MIRTVAELLRAFIVAEDAKLRKLDITHPPTIGSMYEGLTRSALDVAIPESLNLHVVDGFIRSPSGRLSGQIDCMLTRGVGEPVPHTTQRIVRVSDVIAVLEVKKTLYGADLVDAFDHLRVVQELHSEEMQSNPEHQRADISSARRAFARTVGKVAPAYESLNLLPAHEQMLFHMFVAEQMSPIRVAFGYDGFKVEEHFREKLYGFLEEKLHEHGYGPLHFPHLIVSGQYSLVKVNGQPYTLPAADGGWWQFLVSYDGNPLVPLLELIWTRLSRQESGVDLFAPEEKVEAVRPFLAARSIEMDGKTGWSMTYCPLSEKALRTLGGDVDWHPIQVGSFEYEIFHRLCTGEVISIDDREFQDAAQKFSDGPVGVVGRLLATMLIALDGSRLVLTSERCMCWILPDKGFVVADDVNGTMSNWIARNYGRAPDGGWNPDSST